MSFGAKSRAASMTTDTLSEQQISLGQFRTLVMAYGRRRAGSERHTFVKLDSWHTLALPLFRRAFPSVPWLFLYREPIEVLVSQMRQRGTQMVAEIMPPSLYGIDNAGGMRAEEYCARVLNRICTAVIDNYGAGGGLLVNYRELPGAIWTRSGRESCRILAWPAATTSARR